MFETTFKKNGSKTLIETRTTDTGKLVNRLLVNGKQNGKPDIGKQIAGDMSIDDLNNAAYDLVAIAAKENIKIQG